MKVEVDVPVPNSPYGLSGRKATLNLNMHVTELRSCAHTYVAVLGFPSLIIHTISVDVKQLELAS